MSLPVSVNVRVPDVRAVFSADDFPSYLLSGGPPVAETVYTRTTVRPDGTIQDCSAEGSSGDVRLDGYTCAIIVKRAKFTPARWDDGAAVYGVIRVPVSWHAGYGVPSDQEMLKAIIPDLDISVNRLPNGAPSIVGVSLEIEADESGKPLMCAEQPRVPKADSKKHYPELVPIACQQVMAQLTVIPPVDASGKRVRSVQAVSVHFKLDH
jgi:hypothetical protein